jgi:hypothetical protein
MVADVAVKILYAPEIVVIGIFPNAYIRRLDQIFKEAQFVIMLQGKGGRRIWTCHA